MAFKRWSKTRSKQGLKRAWAESEMKVIGWCLNNNIKISVSPDWKHDLAHWQIDININGKNHNDPTKMYKGNDGKIEEPTMYNIKGGGEWYDASYHGLLVHRDYDAKTTKVKVLKVKFQNLGENGAESHFTWEPKSGSFIPNEPVTAEVDGLPWE